MKCVGTAFLLCLCSFSSLAAPQKLSSTEKTNTSQIVKGDAEAGKLKSEDNRCQECHGLDGNGQGPAAGAAGKFAKLAGQYPDYISKQLRDFRNGERKHDLMQIMAKSIDETDSADIAAYFSSQKKMHGNGTGVNETGKNLFDNGDVARNIVPCTSCHGANGRGLETPQPGVPIIGGQEWHYLQKQLFDWRSGERHNSEGEIMNRITKSLTDKEIITLTDYISGL